MARTTRVLGFSVSPEIAEAFDTLAQAERRSKSELFREMFRVYQQYRRKRTEFDGQWMMDIVREAKAMSDDEFEALNRELTEYGARRTKEMGLEHLTDDDIQNIVHAHRRAQTT